MTRIIVPMNRISICVFHELINVKDVEDFLEKSKFSINIY